VVCFTTSSEVLMMFGFTRTIEFYALGSLNSICECYMLSFPAVLTLWYSRIHIHTFDGCYVAPYIETSVDNVRHIKFRH